MGRILMLAVLALILGGCAGLPDPRHGTIVVDDPELELAAVTASSWWGTATRGDVRFRFARSCGDADSCLRISAIDGEVTEWGGSSVQRPGSDEPGWVTIHIARWLTNDPELATELLAHEFGHALFLGHVATADELMNAVAGPCIGPETLQEYADEWGTAVGVPICDPLRR